MVVAQEKYASFLLCVSSNCTVHGSVKVILMSFFVSVCAKASEASKALIATHELSPPNGFTCEQYIPDGEKFNLCAASSHQIRRAIKSFSSNKAPGFDKVTMSVIKDARPCILPVLTDIIDNSFFLQRGKYLKSFQFQRMEITRYQITIERSRYFLQRQRFVSVLPITN